MAPGDNTDWHLDQISRKLDQLIYAIKDLAKDVERSRRYLDDINRNTRRR